MADILRKVFIDLKIEISKRKEYCPCCGSNNFILHAPFKKNLKTETRNNYACFNCLSLSRHRALAKLFLRHFNLSSLDEFKAELRSGKIRVYDANVPPLFPLLRESDYVISSFLPNKKIKFQDLEKLTFKSSRFDVVITCDILEHVFDLKKAVAEIYRVLKPGGAHFFTLPVNFKAERTIIRARKKGNRIIYLKKPLYHYDAFFKDVLAVRDFGGDFAEYVAFGNGVRTYKRKWFGENVEVFLALKKDIEAQNSKIQNTDNKAKKNAELKIKRATINRRSFSKQARF